MCVRVDQAENIKMDKSKSTEKIDDRVATFMELDRAIINKKGLLIRFTIQEVF